MISTLEKGLQELNIEYTQEQIDKNDLFYDLLMKKNEVMNLTRITDKEEFYIKHILDSLLIVKAVNINGKRIIDVGTGAGFPGIPVKIFFPDTSIVLMDSLKKRLLFLDEVIKELDLSDIYTLHGRAEDLGKEKKYREYFDLVMSRAVADMCVLSEYCIPFVSLNGVFIAYKSEDSDTEIKNAEKVIDLLGGADFQNNKMIIPCSDILRNIVVIKKQKLTPTKYPRKAGTPSKLPIK